MRNLWLNCAAAMLLSSSVLADGLSDASAGLAALDQGNNTEAIRLFTRAISQGKLSNDDLELAYVKRAQAYIGEKKNSLALLDLAKAKVLKPDDGDIDNLQAQAGKPAGPSLIETIQFLEQNFGYSSNFIVSGRDTIKNADFSNQFSDQVTNVSRGANSCSLNYHELWSRDGKMQFDKNFSISFNQIRSVEEMPVAQFTSLANAREGHPEEEETGSTPTIYTIHVTYTNNAVDDFDYSDDDQAEKIGKALQHASELCGSKQPF